MGCERIKAAMCAIVDANKFGEFKSRNPGATAMKFHEWMRGENGGVLVYPEIESLDKAMEKESALKGKAREDAFKDMSRLIDEYRRSPNMLFLLGQYFGAGRARRVKLSEVAKRHPETAKARSDDRHILALALASGARLLYTGDMKLKKDFENPEIIGDPPGVVYASVEDGDRLDSSICRNC